MPELSGMRRVVVLSLAATVAVIVTPYISGDWLPVLMTASALAVGVVGFNLLHAAGQLSLGHAFFMGIGGFGYAYFAGHGSGELSGLGLPPLVALVLAAAFAGVLGLLFSPITSRLGGLSLGAASLGLVFLGEHILPNATSFTGGTTGRAVDTMTILGFELGDEITVWYFVAGVAALSFLFAARIARSRIGLALNAIRDGELFAGSMGVRIRRHKAEVFFVSSIYAGLSGALLGLVAGVLVPESFTLMMSLNILMMAILGGTSAVVLGSVAGALVFAFLPELLRRYADIFPFVVSDGAGGGVTPSEAANYIYGAAIVAIVIAEPEGLVALVRRLIAALVTRRRFALSRQQVSTTKG